VFQLLPRISQRVALNLQVAKGKYQVPVRALHVGDRLDGALPKLRVCQ
jgi:hypothetical protein